MRLASGFFASSPNFKLETYQHAFKINIPKEWTWFFLEKNQIFLFYQDPVHLVTKWRNRLFSATADLCFGTDKSSIKHIEELIDNDQYTKLDHGITQSDTNPKDRQNYRSCVKLISDDVINLLTDRKDTEGTVIYLMLLKMIVRAYMDKSVTLSELLPDQLNEIDKLDIKQIINNAYDQATHIVQHSQMLDVLKRHDLIKLQNLSEFVCDNLSKTSKMRNFSSQITNYYVDEFGLDDENDDDNVLNDEQNQLDDEALLDFENDDDVVDEEDVLTSTKSELNGIRIFDNIDPNLKQSYFKIKLNGKIKYLHKQSAC
ncbi:unnamed protein product [Rotaria socialis]|uniref:Uncharacterized protein n=1 Tax=Rotaria socialis TaxID=392032 RepID=A0A821V8X3_9BILA|nr:unnamed protein product [Rotaria socialis]CAF4903575.1 unnamed protein product [Rotaria socialis]